MLQKHKHTCNNLFQDCKVHSVITVSENYVKPRFSLVRLDCGVTLTQQDIWVSNNRLTFPNSPSMQTLSMQCRCFPVCHANAQNVVSPISFLGQHCKSMLIQFSLIDISFVVFLNHSFYFNSTFKVSFLFLFLNLVHKDSTTLNKPSLSKLLVTKTNYTFLWLF